jgi:hypothetical protein
MPLAMANANRHTGNFFVVGVFPFEINFSFVGINYTTFVDA